MKNLRKYIQLFYEVIKDTFDGFIEFKVLKMSASLAYITVFSLAPLLLVILFICDVFWGREAIEGAIYSQVNSFVGTSSAIQIQAMIQNLALSKNSTVAAVIGIGTLLFGATSVFAEIQDSINTIWGLRHKKKSGFWLFIKARLLSFGVIGSLGFILLVALGFSTLLDGISNQLTQTYTEISIVVFYVSNLIATLIITSLLFGAIFTILPDADITWKQVRVAAFTTTILFILGKFLITFYIANSNISDVYGAAGSIVVLMVWVYYSSVILYLGATFAKCYAIKFAEPIKPSKYAEIVQYITVTTDAKTIQSADDEIKELKKEPDISIEDIKPS
ncbi:MAG TPA: YihY/virulence factor BrkB family protein [Flavobacterium sp.]|jgi:membrane protein|nr:YihY/virulence factor BrkB family protein [Flavobacterium sp.]HQX04563.1 YihY/virulence factor BrkB family protein [Flavobacterium sp.]HRZ32670.1 YihY/virulence factor BrkB family protein [Flavobacterium sp.]HRZ75310.1 YihY/virulence factor BrkB family protein [Flavobacterium sp.]